jgi:hypothetical protein
LFLPGNTVSSVTFSTDGKTLAAGFEGYFTSPEGGVTLWDVDPEAWVQRAGRIANRNFSRNEWLEYFPDEPYRPTFPDLPVPPEDSTTRSTTAALPKSVEH